jgi:hypothetical protein
MIHTYRTLAYYFSLEYFREIATEAGLAVDELSYATVSVKNRKPTSKDTQKKMDRVFVHAVLRRAEGDAGT